MEFDVISLPSQWRVTHVQLRRRLSIGRAAPVEFCRMTKRVKNLNLVSILNVNATVPAFLVPRVRLERQIELDVQLEILVLGLGLGAGLDQMTGIHRSILPGIDVRSVKEDDSSCRRLFTFIRADAVDALEFEGSAVIVRAGQGSVSNRRLPT